MNIAYSTVDIDGQPIQVDGSGVTQPVSGTVTVSNPGLTDTELRATPVPVTIPTPVPVTDNSGSLTVDGTVTVANPGLTDTELRATPVPVSGTVNTNPATSASASVARVSVTAATAATLLASNANRKAAIFHNEGGTLYLKFGSAASDIDYTYRLTTNSVAEITTYTGIVTGIKASGTSNVQVTEI